MKVLTKDTDYAVRAMMVLAQNHGRRVSSRKISEMQEIPYQFLRRIVQKLAKEGFVETREGSGGGVKLAGMSRAFGSVGEKKSAKIARTISASTIRPPAIAGRLFLNRCQTS